jgi:hypothetical protein
MFFGGKRGDDNKLLIVLFLLIGALIVGILFYDVTSSFSRNDEAKRVYYVYDNAMLMDVLTGASGSALVKYPFDLESYELDIEDGKLILTDQRKVNKGLKIGGEDDNVHKEALLALDSSVDINIGDIDDINYYKKVSDLDFSTGSRFSSRGYVCESPGEVEIKKVIFDPIYSTNEKMNTYVFIFKNTFSSSSAGYNFYTSRSQGHELSLEERKAFAENIAGDFYLSTKASQGTENDVIVYYPVGDEISRYVACKILNSIIFEFDVANGAAIVPIQDTDKFAGRNKESILIEFVSPDWENSIFYSKTYPIHVSIIDAFDSMKKGDDE